MAAGTQHGLKNILWKKIKENVIDDHKKPGEWRILILDHFTTKLLSSCCKMSDLMSEGITIVEDLYKNREPVPEMKAIYLISPSEKGVDSLVNDFKNTYKYKAAYIYFTDCSRCIVFTLDNPDAFHSIYSTHRTDKDTTLQKMAEQIVTLCATLDENPGVRYRKEPLDNASMLAQLVENKLCKHYELDEKCKKKSKTQAQLLIVDRGFDPVSPILHELTYQAMVYDLISIENDTYKYLSKDGVGAKEKQSVLNEEDDLWTKLRHMHIAEVSEKIPKLVKEISANKKIKDGKITMSGLSQLMKKMPSFRKQISKQTVHLNLAEECMNHFQANVEKLCKVEQDLALGADTEGQKIKDPMRTLLPVLLQKHSTYDKIRAVLLYIFSLNGTTEENLRKIFQQIDNESSIILNWNLLGVPIHSSSSQQRKTSRKDRSHEETYQLSRWTPVIKDVIEDAIDNKLDTKEWPHISECPAAWNGSGAVSARQKHKGSSQDDRRSGSRLIVFIIGGVSYSEMRCAYEVTQAVKSCEVIIGSTHILTPRSLLEAMQDLSKTKGPMETFNIIEEKAA
ncbi:syntaxin-binding protein 3-like [Polyodon spathula]|uniref:syntaxin-binding protein 3-like n=1 Tax=Polyodon spathula TaxID=7913 RepID=UPI001B7DF610|nr:syntaxin-binding protein 3-like [Polyodon spathula]